SGAPAWAAGQEVRSYSFTNSTEYLYYRLNVSQNRGGGFLAVAEFALYDPDEGAAATALDAAMEADSPVARWTFGEDGTLSPDYAGSSPLFMRGSYTRGTG